MTESNLLFCFLKLQIPSKNDLANVPFDARCDYIAKIGYPLYTKEVVNLLQSLLKRKRVIEVGAGTGYLSRLLKQQHINITAVDDRKSFYGKIFDDYRFCRLHIGDAVHYIKKNRYDTIIMSWPAYDDPFAANIVKAMRSGTELIYIGESNGGCTGDDQFFAILEDEFDERVEWSSALTQNHRSFEFIYDTIRVFWKK